MSLANELNKGGDITSGLKKVAREETNKDKKISGKVEVKEAAPKAAAPKQPARVELQGTKWTVEFHHHTKEPVVVKTTGKNQTVYIYKCEGAVVVIEGKANSIAIDGCKKTGVVFDECIATCEVMNSASIQLQVKEKVPAIAVDKTAGIQIDLPKTSLDTEIVTATSSEMNVIIPNPKGDDQDPVELPIPEQFKTVVKNGKLHTEEVSHSGG